MKTATVFVSSIVLLTLSPRAWGDDDRDAKISALEKKVDELSAAVKDLQSQEGMSLALLKS